MNRKLYIEVYYTLQIFDKLCRVNAQTFIYQQFFPDMSRE